MRFFCCLRWFGVSYSPSEELDIILYVFKLFFFVYGVVRAVHSHWGALKWMLRTTEKEDDHRRTGERNVYSRLQWQLEEGRGGSKSPELDGAKSLCPVFHQEWQSVWDDCKPGYVIMLCLQRTFTGEVPDHQCRSTVTLWLSAFFFMHGVVLYLPLIVLCILHVILQAAARCEFAFVWNQSRRQSEASCWSSVVNDFFLHVLLNCLQFTLILHQVVL